jgi:hypothetical protein
MTESNSLLLVSWCKRLNDDTYESKEVKPLTSLSIFSLTLFESIAAFVYSNGRCKRDIYTARERKRDNIPMS